MRLSTTMAGSARQNYLSMTQIVTMIMMIATNCSRTRSRISRCAVLSAPPRIMLARPRSSPRANATVRAGEALIAALDGAREALLFGSGMSAAPAAVMALPRGAHVVASEVMYWAFRNWLVTEAPRLGITVDLVATSDLKAVRAAVKRGKTKLVWIETPANPLWTVSDIAGLPAIAHRAGAKLAVDSTAATPVFTRPLVLGADLVMHSATKFLNGHSDVVAGPAAPRPTGGRGARIKRLGTHAGLVRRAFQALPLLSRT